MPFFHVAVSGLVGSRWWCPPAAAGTAAGANFTWCSIVYVLQSPKLQKKDGTTGVSRGVNT